MNEQSCLLNLIIRTMEEIMLSIFNATTAAKRAAKRNASDMFQEEIKILMSQKTTRTFLPTSRA